VFHHTSVLVLALGIGIGIGQYYWVLGALFGIVLTLLIKVMNSIIISSNFSEGTVFGTINNQLDVVTYLDTEIFLFL